MSGSREGDDGSWGSRFLKAASVVAASAAVAGGLYAFLSSSASANSELEAPFSSRREHKQGDDTALSSPRREASSKERWTKPDNGWVKLNVDGSRDHDGPSAGCGGVLRDELGTWLDAFALKLDPEYQAHKTELKAILVGLEWASEMNFPKLIIESDNEDMVNKVENDGLMFKNHRDEYGVVQRIRELCFDYPKWEVELVSIDRSANRVAHRLANKARALSSHDLQKYTTPPEDCESLHLEDIGQGRVRF